MSIPANYRAMRRLSIQKEAFMVKKEKFREDIADVTNHDGMLNKSLPDDLEDNLMSCLQAVPITLSKEEDVRNSYLHHYDKTME